MEIKCPNCDKRFEYYKSESRPFCCEKCKLIDLGAWLNESYTIASQGEKNEEVDERTYH